MARLSPINFRFDSKAGDEVVAWKADVNVTSTGVFSISVPDALRESLAQHANRVLDKAKVPASYIDHSKHSVVEAKTLDAAAKGVELLIEDYLECTVVHDLVIAYTVSPAYAIYEYPDGSLHPDGVDSPREPGQVSGLGKWHGGLLHSSLASNDYHLALAAKVYQRTRWTRTSGIKTSYRMPSQEELGPHGTYLNRFQRMAVVIKDAQVIPYTEDAAKFFGTMIMSLATLSLRVEKFFANPEALATAINQQQTLSLKEDAHASDLC